MRRVPAVGIVVLVMLTGCLQRSAPPCKEDLGPPDAGEPVVVLNTSLGEIRLQLYQELTPITTGNFLNLTRDGFYDGNRFHRVIGPAKQPPSGFMIQDGDPLTKDVSQKSQWGTGGSNETIPDEFPTNESGGLRLRHDRAGTLSMANRGPDTGSSQFFVTLAATPWLDGAHTVFGRVVGCMDPVRAIGSVSTGENDRPVQDVLIRTARVGS